MENRDITTNNMIELITEKSKIFCPVCGKKKVFWLDCDDFTHYCKNCKETFICKGSTYIQ